MCTSSSDSVAATCRAGSPRQQHALLYYPECWSIDDWHVTDNEFIDDFQCRVTAYGDGSSVTIQGTVGSDSYITLDQFTIWSGAGG